MKLQILFLLLFKLLSISLSFKCGHHLFAETSPKRIKIPNSNLKTRIAEENNFDPIEINIDYTYLTSNVSNVKEETIAKVKESFEEVAEMYKTLIKVQHLGNIQYQESLSFCSDNINVHPALAKGIEEDFILFPIFLSEKYLGSGVIAGAKACVAADNGRPIVGIVYLRDNIDFQTNHFSEYYKMILFHEVTHALVFSPGLFRTFPNQPYYVTKNVNGIERNLLATPKVLEVARKHFGCDSLEGVELENQGGQGSVGSHWESRVMLGDYMISFSYEDYVISEITLAVFEDSGWYKVNYYTGNLFKFGKGEGCSFLNEKCVIEKNAPKAKFKEEFCLESGEGKCYSSRTGKGNCGLFTYDSNIQEEYQYFSNPKRGGMAAVDYCPVVSSYETVGNSGYYQNHCKYGKTTDENFREKYGADSMCIEGKWYEFLVYSLCYKVKCNNDSMKIYIGDEDVECTKENIDKEIELKSIEGLKIMCPNVTKVCPKNEYCNNVDDCLKNKITSDIIEDLKKNISNSSDYLMFISPSIFLVYLFIVFIL